MTALCIKAAAVVLMACAAAARHVPDVQPLFPSGVSSSEGVRAAQHQPQMRRLLAASDAASRRPQLRQLAHSSVPHGDVPLPSTGRLLRAWAMHSGGGGLQQAAPRRHGRRLRQNQGSRRCESGTGCVIAFSLLLAGAVTFLCSALCYFCCCKRTPRQRRTALTLAVAAAARAEAGDSAAAAVEIMSKQLVTKIGDAHVMAGMECPVCLDTPCEVVLPCNHGCCHICLDKLITRGARLTLCPICRERILPPDIEPVAVMAPGSTDCPAASSTNGDTDGGGAGGGGGADVGSDSRTGWRRLLPQPLPYREWVMVVWARQRRGRRQQRRQASAARSQAPAGAIAAAHPTQLGASQ